MSWYKVSFAGEEYIDIEAEYFQIEDGGVLAFYEAHSTVTSTRRPFRAFNEWRSVKKRE